MIATAQGLTLPEAQALFTRNDTFTGRIKEIARFTQETGHEGAMAVYRSRGQLVVSKGSLYERSASGAV